MSEAEWDEYIDVLYEQWVARHEAYAFEDNYEPFEQCKLYSPNSQSKTS